ncbi:MAG: COQ9 family protein [Rickettsiales bacterium]|jgi:ubiquinone biosynthesis protein COQ9|nr:COQ9 family protein [Rickettsiales bacterium]
MDKIKAARDIITRALPHVAFEGWTQSVLSKAALEAGYKKTDAIRVFPNGAIEAVDTYFLLMDSQMLQALSAYHLESMKIRERAALCVRLWLEPQEGHKEALRRAIALQTLPLHASHALSSLYHTVDEMWRAIGDTSTDFNFYTKRLLLGGVLTSTTLYWLNDTSAGHFATWQFLDRRIADVMQIEKAKYRAKSWFEQLSKRATSL